MGAGNYEDDRVHVCVLGCEGGGRMERRGAEMFAPSSHTYTSINILLTVLEKPQEGKSLCCVLIVRACVL